MGLKVGVRGRVACLELAVEPHVQVDDGDALELVDLPEGVVVGEWWVSRGEGSTPHHGD